MEATLANNSVTSSLQNTQSNTSKSVSQGVKTKSDSLEFVSGCIYIFKKVFLLG